MEKDVLKSFLMEEESWQDELPEEDLEEDIETGEEEEEEEEEEEL
ncbi:MAG: hypothetical protein PHH17_02980 [Candidatus Pacebacteria bacterium]|nr:hypothetical protein [Candidatus Paceibacterota bacterium]MDD3072627.1 hypothetical protein [Candidatus Paceibacterota bacterium]MDD3729328.1 hypothetical protein [Candidatus Paceibacterota bacterium]MDD4201683.1 hypothetical protein [Candidatus Paceibacterota bacterium]MDD4467387.1 hypothetical protein [Candidatus Paceibacterota bacterium]